MTEDYVLVQAEAGGSGSQGSHHSPKAVTGSPAKKQKTGMAPATQPTSTGIGELLSLILSRGPRMVCRKLPHPWWQHAICHKTMSVVSGDEDFWYCCLTQQMQV